MNRKILLKWSLLCLLFQPVSGQMPKIHGFTETGILMGTSGRIPFWMLTDQYGRFTPKSVNSYMEAGIFSDTIQKGRKFDWDWGIDGFGRYDGIIAGWLQQGYVGGKAWFLYLYAGLKEEHFGDQNPILSSGFPTWSGNARPVPKISLSTLDYIPLKFTKNFVEIKFGISNGWFGGNGYVKQAMLHHKYFYLRFGGNSKFHFTAGLHHFVQWGGISPIWGKLPSDLNSFVKVMFAETSNPIDTTLPPNERENRLGNHLGTKDFNFEYQLNAQWNLMIYWQNIIEDITGLEFRIMQNGLWGLSIENKNRFGLSYEFLHTSSSNKKGAFDNYFRNLIYLSGWTYHGFVIGNPLITSPILFASNPSNIEVQNNKVIGHSLFMYYLIKNYKIQGSGTYTINMGTPGMPLPSFYQTDFIISLTRLNSFKENINLGFAISADIGKLFGNHIGFETKLIWNFSSVN